MAYWATVLPGYCLEWVLSARCHPSQAMLIQRVPGSGCRRSIAVANASRKLFAAAYAPKPSPPSVVESDENRQQKSTFR